MDKIIPIAILVLFIILTASWLFSRYRMCPPDKILIVFGKVGTGQPAKCYHGGSTFVLPVLQSYSYLDLNPINIDVPLQGALSSQNIRVDVPSSFIVGISTLPEIMQNAAARLLGRSREEIRNLAAEIIMGQMRVVIASMTIEEINSDREKLIKGITEGVDVELHKVGLHLINANITDIQDASGYINALGKEAAARAINDATIKVAEETRRGEIGKAEAEKDQTIQVANARAIAIEGQNEAQIKIAESAAKLQVKQAEAKKLAEVAQKVQEAKTLEEAYQAEKEAELKRAERERATQEANILVTARIEKSQREVQAQATAEVLKLEQEGKPGQSFIRLGRAPFPLKPEGTDDNADDISPLFLGQTGRFRSYAGSRSPSQPGGKDGQRAAFQRTENGRLAFTGRLGSYGGVSAGTEAPGKPGAQMNLAWNG